MIHIGGFSDLTPGRNVRGGSALIVRLWRIVESPKGSIPKDPSLGWGLPLKLGTKTNATALKVEEAIGRDELKKDPEVSDVNVRISDLGGGAYRVKIAAMPTTGAAVEFERDIRGQV
jgi:hypothetical protein